MSECLPIEIIIIIISCIIILTHYYSRSQRTTIPFKFIRQTLSLIETRVLQIIEIIGRFFFAYLENTAKMTYACEPGRTS